MKLISKILSVLALIPALAFAQDDISTSTGIIGNGRLLGAKTYDGQTTVGILGIDSSGNTVIKSLSGKTVQFPGAIDLTGAISTGNLTVKADGDPQRLHLFDASSDTALTYLFGDSGVTAVQGLFIGASTADADDDATLSLGGGGSASATRGAFLSLAGNETAGDGDATLSTGSDANSDVNLVAAGSSSIIKHIISGTTDTLQMASSGNAALTMSWGDAGVTAVQMLNVGASTADADDDSSLRLYGGGAFGTDGTRGATIVIPGEEVSGGSDITYNAGVGDTHIFQVAGTTQLTVGGSGTLLANATGNIFNSPKDSYLGSTTTTFTNAESATGVGAVSRLYVSYDATANGGNMFLSKGASANGNANSYFHSRGDYEGSTIINNADKIARFRFFGSTGGGFTEAATLNVGIDAAPGAGTDMPGFFDFLVSPDGSATPASALRISNDKTLTFGGTLIGTGTATIGWTVTSVSANTACSTRCTTPAVMGFGLTTDSAFPITGFFDGASASSDICLCAGAS